MKARAAMAKRWAGGKIPLLALSLYGVADGDASHGLEVGRAACWIDARDGTLRFQMIGSSDVDADAPTVPEFAGLDGRRWSGVSLCPDQNSRRVIAWTDGETITVSRIVPDGPSLAERRDTWQGVDCRLGFDAWQLDASAGEATDVIAFYLKPDRVTLCTRLQRENFGVERVYATLEQPCSLDVVARAGLSLSVWCSPGGAVSPQAVVSDPYPARASDAASLGVSLIGGQYFELIVLRDPTLEGASLAASLVGGVYYETIVLRDPTLEGASLAMNLQTGAYNVVIVPADAFLEGASLAAMLQSGAYANVIVDGGAYLEGASLGLSLVGGSYV